ncbi:hypothetical protein [Nocardioides plantarum]|uniref:Uncharacterized protein n=1 Tax=Nocardioides plantarum TaxID=29299 RepID=A0ABV5KF71_9ACTN|nr:hypothetical protein [Nocardioides plantarum]
MPLPTLNTPVTDEQVRACINLEHFPEATPGSKGWHEGLFEPWTRSYGYPGGMAVYGSVTVGDSEHHIYYLNDRRQCPIILRRGETPQNYGVDPEA